jgi:arylsulfatase A-like enzyme
MPSHPLRASLMALMCTLGVSTVTFAADKPNIVVILADDLGYSDIGVQGGPDIPTPFIDSIARNGVRCTSGYVSGAYCSPTRAGLLTGRYQQRFGHEFNEGRGQAPGVVFGLPLTETTLAQRLKALGYVTGAIGKWHLGVEPPFRPMNRGFDEFYGTLSNTPFFHPNLLDSRVSPDPKRVEEESFYTTDAYAARAVEFIEAHKNEPFFLYLPFNACHVPSQAPEKYLDRFEGIRNEERKKYAGMMAALDDAVGVVLGKLRDLKLEENTLVVFLSDNGGPMTKMGQNGSNNRPLRGQKGDVWEGGVRVPYFVQWKGRIPAGRTLDAPVIQLDIAPTALAAAGAEIPANAQFDGVNLLPYLEGKATGVPHDTLYWRFGPQKAVRRGDWKLVQAYDYDQTQAGPPQAAKIEAKPRLIHLPTDIGESKDLSADRSDLVKELQAAWETWNATLPPPAWLPNPPTGAATKKTQSKAATKKKAARPD